MKTIKLILPCMLFLLFFSCSQKEEQQAQAPPPQVTVVVTQAKDVPIYQEFVGQIYGFKRYCHMGKDRGFSGRHSF